MWRAELGSGPTFIVRYKPCSMNGVAECLAPWELAQSRSVPGWRGQVMGSNLLWDWERQSR